MTEHGVSVGRSFGYLAGWVLFAVGCLAGVAAALLWAPSDARLLFACFAGAGAVLGLWGFAYYQAERFVLYPDRIQRKTLFRTIARKRGDITGLRAAGNAIMASAPRPGWQPIIPFYVFKNQDWEAWANSCRNLDYEDFQKNLKTIDEAEVLGAGVEDRRAAARGRARINLALYVVALALVLWTTFWPYPRGLPIYISIALPPVACLLAAVFRAVFRISPDGPPTHIDLSILVGAAICGVGLGAMRAPLVDWGHALLFAALAAVLVTVIAAFIADRAKWPWLSVSLGIGFFAFVYAWGSATMLNIMLDEQRPRLVRAHVQGVSGRAHYKPKLGAYVLDDRPFERISMPVAERTFVAHENGEPICALVFNGRFGWRWTQLEPCSSFMRTTG